MSYSWDHAWRVVTWTIVEVWSDEAQAYVRESEPTPGTCYTGREEGARNVFARYAEAGVRVELRYQGPPVTPPEEVLAVANVHDAMTEEDSDA